MSEERKAIIHPQKAAFEPMKHGALWASVSRGAQRLVPALLWSWWPRAGNDLADSSALTLHPTYLQLAVFLYDRINKLIKH